MYLREYFTIKLLNAYLRPYQISMVEIIRKNTLQFLTVNYFLEKFPLKMFYRILNKPPMCCNVTVVLI